MKNGLLLGLLAAQLMAGSVQAGAMGPVRPDWNWVGAISVGPTWESAGRQQTFYLAPEIEKTYTADKVTKTLVDVEAFLGIQRAVSSAVQGQLGLAVGVTNDANLSGVIWDDADPRFDNYSYRYKVQHTHIALKGKLLADMGYWVMPWVSASIGVGFNHAHAFNNTSLIYEAVKNPNFTSHTQTAFTYTLGAGIQKALTQHWQVGVGYEFADWGKNHLGRALGQTMNTGPYLNHLYTNGVLFNLTYLT